MRLPGGAVSSIQTTFALALVVAGVAILMLAVPGRAGGRARGHPGVNSVAIESFGVAGRASQAAYFSSRRGLGFGVPVEGYRRATAQMRAQERSLAGAGEIGDPAQLPGRFDAWQFVGPQPLVGELPNFGGAIYSPPLPSATGSVTALAADPTSPGRLFVGTASGGLWMRSSPGGSFFPIFDRGPTESIGAIALDTTASPPVIYVGTGEGNNAGDSYYGRGIFVSTDLGVSWQALGSGRFDKSSIATVAIDSSRQPPLMFAGVSYGSSADSAGASIVESDLDQNGLWRSTDGGQSWLPYPSGTFGQCPYFRGPCPAESVVIDPRFPSKVYAAILGTGVFRSTDSGASFEQVNLPGIGSDVGRASVAAYSHQVYAVVGARDGAALSGFFYSTDGGTTWSPQAIPEQAFSGVTIDGSEPSSFSQSLFQQAIAIDPGDASGRTVVFGGVGIYRSTDAGATWMFLAPTGGTHDGQHAIAFDPAARVVSLGLHPTSDNTIVAGLAENGAALFDGTRPRQGAWRSTDPRSGGFSLCDQSDPSIAYHSFATTA